MIREEIIAIVNKAVSKTPELKEIAQDLDFSIERPRHKKFGDWSTNVAMIAAPLLNKNPRQVAKAINDNLDNPRLEKSEIAGPGFINLFFKNEWYYDVLRNIEKAGDSYGEVDIGKGQKVLLEFVSANPVGPLHVGHGRWAAVGDSLARVLRKARYSVTTEFYVNDHGLQIELHAKSIIASAMEQLGKEAKWPKNGYKGAYIKAVSAKLLKEYGEEILKKPKELTRLAYELELKEIKDTLHKFDVNFDNYFYESKLHESNKVKKIIEELKKKNRAYENDDALWFKTGEYGDEKDRVLVRSNGQKTYFAADIAYHEDKLKKRQYDKLINIWGADHHGYIARVKAAITALGENPDKLVVILGQLVNLFRDKKLVRMSKRTGDIITLDELLTEVGKDATRFIFLTKSTDTPLDFDIDLAKEQSDKNPVFYVQYAYARISSILKFAEEKGIRYQGIKTAKLELLKEEKELELIKTLEEFEEVIEKISNNLTPHLLASYAGKLATGFHSFYTVAKIITEDKELTQARLALMNSARVTLKNVLKLLGVSTPEKM